MNVQDTEAICEKKTLRRVCVHVHPIGSKQVPTKSVDEDVLHKIYDPIILIYGQNMQHVCQNIWKI